MKLLIALLLPILIAKDESVSMDHISHEDDIWQQYVINESEVEFYEDRVLNGDLYGGLYLLNPLNFHLHTDALFDEFPANEDYAKEFMNHLAQENLLDLITPCDVVAAEPVLCSEFGRFIKILHPKLAKMSERCFVSMAENIADEDVKLVPIEFVERFPVQFVRQINIIAVYSPEQIKIVTNIVACCRELESSNLKFVGRRDQWEAINPMCLAEAKRIGDIDFSPQLLRDIIPGNIFSYYSGTLSDATMTFLGAKHLRYFGTEVAQFPRGNLNLRLIQPSAAPGVTADMFYYFLKEVDEPVFFEEHWKLFPKNLFSVCQEGEDLRYLASKIHGDSYQYMTKRQIATILSHPEGCAGVSENATISKSLIEKIGLSSKCFAAMHPHLRMKIISSGAALPDNILEYVGSQELLSMKFSIFSLNKLRGKNLVKMIENLSSKIDDRHLHACRLIKDPEILRSLRIFKKAMPKNCWKFMSMKIKAKNVLKNPTLFAGRPKVLKTLLENEKGLVSNLNRVTKRGIEKLTAGRAGRECRYMDYISFRSLNGHFRSGLSSICVANLPFLSDLDEEEMIHFAPKAFSHIDFKLAKKLYFNRITNRHLEHLSEAINFTRTAGASLTRDVLENQVKPNRLSHLPGRVWGTVPPSAFAIFSSADILARIPGEKMVYWTKEQVEMIPKKVLAELNKEQATLVGSLSGEKRALVKYLVGIVPRKNIAKTVLGERFNNQVNRASLSAQSIAYTFALTGLMTAAILF